MRRLLATLLFLGLAACGKKEYVCQRPSECLDTYGAPGQCLQMRCAFSDRQCASGYRWDDSAGARAGECVEQLLIPDASPDASRTSDAAPALVDAAARDAT